MPQIFGLTNTTIPAPATENTQNEVRINRYGDLSVVTTLTPPVAQCVEGSHFIAMGATPNAGIATPILSTLSSETAGPALIIYNSNAGANTKNLIIDFIRLYTTVIPANSTDAQVQFAIDAGNRLNSGGTGLTPVNCNMNSVTATNATVTFGVPTATAPSGARRFVEWYQFKTAAITVKDLFVFNFGQLGASSESAFANQSTTASIYNYSFGPIVIGPGQSLLMYLFYASNSGTGTALAPVVSWYER